MHDGMQYDPIQGQGHEPLKVGIFFPFSLCFLNLFTSLLVHFLITVSTIDMFHFQAGHRRRRPNLALVLC